MRCDGVTVPVRPGKQRAVLAMLLLDAGQIVPVDQIAEALWGSDPPPSARVTMQNYVMRLRKALGATGRDRIGTQPGGYLISVFPGELDVSRFETLLVAACAAVRDSSWDTAAHQAGAALALWRGEPLADVRSEVLALREIPRLAEMRMRALEARIEADLHRGHQAEVIAELQRLVGVHPLREHLHSLLMLALYRDGRQGEALSAYQHARSVLIGELGTEPGTGLRQLHQWMLTADPALAVPEPGRPDPGSSRPVIPRQLPPTARHFVGRAGELAALTGLLDQAGGMMSDTVAISAITGTAGVGKTALAVQWAHRVADQFADGQLYINLHGFGPSKTPVAPADAIRRFLDALGVAAERVPPSPEACEDMYRSMLAGRQMLIILDNAHDAAQVRPLLSGGPGGLVVVTSRSQLVGLVAAEGALPLTLDVLSEADARELLTRRLGADRIADEPGVVSELAGLCASLPLALTAAAARAATRPGLPLASLVAELQDASGRLDALDPGEAACSVRAVFSWSYQSLSGPAARMFRLLGDHPGSDISVSAAASIAGVPLPQARRALGELTRSNLLSERAQGRFACHDLLRAYAAERAGAEEDEAGLPGGPPFPERIVREKGDRNRPEPGDN